MSKVLITTVCSADEFSYYIPMFIYSVKRAYPAYYVKIFVTGELPPDIKNFLPRLKQMCNYNWEILENQFSEVPKMRTYLNNALRHFVPDEHYAGYDYGYITDVDFLIFRHKPTLKQHFERLIIKCKTPYVSARGPYRKPRRKNITRHGWIKKFKRVISGRVFFKVPEYLDKTKKQRDAYYRRILKDEHDSWDTHKPGSYREYDEVMFNRILKESGLRTPRKPAKTVCGLPIGSTYRDIHLGDFKFDKRAHATGKLKKRIRDENINHFRKMENEAAWKEVVAVCCKNDKIREVMRRLRKHVTER